MSKPSRHITGKQATAYFAAMKHARDQVDPPNLSVTLNLSCTDCPPGEASPVMQQLVNDRFGRWLRNKSHKSTKAGGPGHILTYTWVVENKDGIQHVHWCLRLDEKLRSEFEHKLPKWVRSAAGKINDPKRCINIKDISFVMGLARYCMKGINPQQASRRFVRPENQGVVYGKRVAISRSLGRAARRAKAVDQPEAMAAAA